MRDGRNQLGFRAAFEAQAERLACVEHLLDNLVQLVDLDRIDCLVDVLVARLRDRFGERQVESPHARAKHVLEAQQHRKPDAAAAQLRHHVHDVDAERAVIERQHRHVATLVDSEKTVAPGVDSIQFGSILDAPGRSVTVRSGWASSSRSASTALTTRSVQTYPHPSKRRAPSRECP